MRWRTAIAFRRAARTPEPLRAVGGAHTRGGAGAGWPCRGQDQPRDQPARPPPDAPVHRWCGRVGSRHRRCGVCHLVPSSAASVELAVWAHTELAGWIRRDIAATTARRGSPPITRPAGDRGTRAP